MNSKMGDIVFSLFLLSGIGMLFFPELRKLSIGPLGVAATLVVLHLANRPAAKRPFGRKELS